MPVKPDSSMIRYRLEQWFCCFENMCMDIDNYSVLAGIQVHHLQSIPYFTLELYPHVLTICEERLRSLYDTKHAIRRSHPEDAKVVVFGLKAFGCPNFSGQDVINLMFDFPLNIGSPEVNFIGDYVQRLFAEADNSLNSWKRACNRVFALLRFLSYGMPPWWFNIIVLNLAYIIYKKLTAFKELNCESPEYLEIQRLGQINYIKVLRFYKRDKRALLDFDEDTTPDVTRLKQEVIELKEAVDNIDKIILVENAIDNILLSKTYSYNRLAWSQRFYNSEIGKTIKKYSALSDPLKLYDFRDILYVFLKKETILMQVEAEKLAKDGIEDKIEHNSNTLLFVFYHLNCVKAEWDCLISQLLDKWITKFDAKKQKHILKWMCNRMIERLNSNIESIIGETMPNIEFDINDFKEIRSHLNEVIRINHLYTELLSNYEAKEIQCMADVISLSEMKK
jgi:hypothetical protein